MKKLTLATALVLAAFSAPALAASWNITEESTSGIKSAQGSWLLKGEGDAFTGTATLQRDNGTEVSYVVDGTLKDGIYTVKLDNAPTTRRAASGRVTRRPPPPSARRRASSVTWFAKAPSWYSRQGM